MAVTGKNTAAAQEASDQAEYNLYLTEAPIADFAGYAGISIDEAVNRRVAAALEAAPLKLDVQVWPIEPKGNLMGFASLKINNGFVVDDFKVLQGEKGLFVGMPSKPDGKGGYRDTARPITKEFRAGLTQAVTAAYREAVERLQSRAAALPPPEKKQPVREQLENGAKQAAAHNARRQSASDRPAPVKGGKAKGAEL
jgi:DNA-binding cell septation regulator SpoVG